MSSSQSVDGSVPPIQLVTSHPEANDDDGSCEQNSHNGYANPSESQPLIGRKNGKARKAKAEKNDKSDSTSDEAPAEYPFFKSGCRNASLRDSSFVWGIVLLLVTTFPVVPYV